MPAKAGGVRQRIWKLKCKTVYSHHYETYEEVKSAVTKWIHYYTNQRIKEKLGGKSPVQYRILTTEKAA